MAIYLAQADCEAGVGLLIDVRDRLNKWVWSNMEASLVQYSLASYRHRIIHIQIRQSCGGHLPVHGTGVWVWCPVVQTLPAFLFQLRGHLSERVPYLVGPGRVGGDGEEEGLQLVWVGAHLQDLDHLVALHLAEKAGQGGEDRVELVPTLLVLHQ